MDLLKALKIAASAADRPTGNPAAKALVGPPIFAGFRWPAWLHGGRAVRLRRALDLHGARRSPVRAEGVAEAARAMIRRAALPLRG